MVREKVRTAFEKAFKISHFHAYDFAASKRYLPHEMRSMKLQLGGERCETGVEKILPFINPRILKKFPLNIFNSIFFCAIPIAL